ncbi:beta-1,3-galactosyltransferase 5-like [Tubulanus polymorphus]|uniref:beta-1,3-galactosyltransferase 5-like n=1 Tax=Tubulanus polymorphus TaxID=672921 RepID=UPI003DA595FC
MITRSWKRSVTPARIRCICVVTACGLSLLLILMIPFNHGPTPTRRSLESPYPKSVDGFEFSMPNIGVCSNSFVEIVVIVISAVKRYEQRQLIRGSWAQWKNDKYKVVFFMGKPGNGTSPNGLANEAETYGDIVQADFRDTYWNLTMKSVLMLRWLNEYCPDAKYAMKVDDDVYVHIPNLANSLEETYKLHRQFFLCRVQYLSIPKRYRNSKFYVSYDEWPETFYPNYCIGGGYSWTNSLTRRLYSFHKRFPMFRMEDVYVTGILGRAADVVHLDNHLIEADIQSTLPNSCEFKDIISYHGLPKSRWLEMWSDLQTFKPLCRTLDFLKMI